MKKLKELYFQFLKFKEKSIVKDKKFWFGVEQIKPNSAQMREFFLNYERESFFDFCKNLKKIIFSKNSLWEPIFSFSTDSWFPYYYFQFLKEKEIVEFKRNGKIVLKKRWLLNFLPKPLSEEEIKLKIEKKLNRKLNLDDPSNSIFFGQAKAEFDQLPISTSSAIFFVSKILEYLPLFKKFLFVGDDDFVSIYLSLVQPKIESVVADIDEQLLGKIENLSKKFHLKIKTKKIDFFQNKNLTEKFVGFLTSPPYTFEGTKAFVNFGVRQFGKDGGFVFLNLADEAIGHRHIFLLEFFAKKRMIVEEVIKNKAYYPWNIVHPEDKIIFERYKVFFDQEKIKKAPMIASSFWIFSFVPFEVKRPKKQPFYAYL